MKTLYLIGETMRVGKTTVSQQLNRSVARNEWSERNENSKS